MRDDQMPETLAVGQLVALMWIEVSDNPMRPRWVRVESISEPHSRLNPGDAWLLMIEDQDGSRNLLKATPEARFLVRRDKEFDWPPRDG